MYGLTSLIFFLQPLAIHMYIKKYYALDRQIHYDVEPIKQKWNGVAQHIAAVILSSSDLYGILFANVRCTPDDSVYDKRYRSFDR